MCPLRRASACLRPSGNADDGLQALPDGPRIYLIMQCFAKSAASLAVQSPLGVSFILVHQASLPTLVQPALDSANSTMANRPIVFMFFPRQMGKVDGQS